MSSFTVIGQSIIFDSIVKIHSETTLILGETHPTRIWELYKHDSLTESLINNYSVYRQDITSLLIEQASLSQVVLEFPVFMEYDLKKYRETGHAYWLNSIMFDSITKNTIIRYVDYLNIFKISIRCIDIPVKNQLPLLRLSLLNILLSKNNVVCYTDVSNNICLDSLQQDKRVGDTLNHQFGNFHNLNVESLNHFSNEIQLLISNLNEKGKSENAKIYNYLQNRILVDSANYKKILADDYIIYTRILQSLKSYLEYKDIKGWHKYQFRERFLSKQFIDVYHPYQLVIIGNSHVNNITPLLYKRRKDYMNFYEILKRDSISMIPSITFMQGINSDRSIFSIEWEKGMRLLYTKSNNKYSMNIYQGKLGEIRIVSYIL